MCLGKYYITTCEIKTLCEIFGKKYDMEKVMNVTSENFNEVVLNSKVPVMVGFYDKFSAPCKILAPKMEILAEEFNEIITVTKIDVEFNQNIVIDYFVKNTPAILIFKNGVVFERIIGMSSISEYKLMINRALED
ncbi:MAG TPA: thiol reductase thioredoxin [Crocinitomicaceae bacterium]|nr:thiol reductase thioredoxin [Flavobacteriales bacterium]HBW85808.1 thiol reductase thioredoxin [Crocinitomicaceae bacterium]